MLNIIKYYVNKGVMIVIVMVISVLVFSEGVSLKFQIK